MGGPIRRDKTFFGAYEGLIERLGITGVASVPDLDARRGILPGRPLVTLHPAISPYINLFFPEPNGRNLGGGIAEYLFSKTQPTDEHFMQGRVDHNFSNNDRLFVRYTIDNGKVSHRVTDAQSFYNAFQLGAVRRFARESATADRRSVTKICISNYRFLKK